MFLIVIIAIALGVLGPLLAQLGRGRLPGEVRIERKDYRFCVTRLIVSALATLSLWIFRR